MHIRQIESLTMMIPHFSRHVEWADIYIYVYIDIYYCTCDGRSRWERTLTIASEACGNETATSLGQQQSSRYIDFGILLVSTHSTAQASGLRGSDHPATLFGRGLGNSPCHGSQAGFKCGQSVGSARDNTRRHRHRQHQSYKTAEQHCGNTSDSVCCRRCHLGALNLVRERLFANV